LYIWGRGLGPFLMRQFGLPGQPLVVVGARIEIEFQVDGIDEQPAAHDQSYQALCLPRGHAQHGGCVRRRMEKEEEAQCWTMGLTKLTYI
jgi:hypothetical protein